MKFWRVVLVPVLFFLSACQTAQMSSNISMSMVGDIDNFNNEAVTSASLSYTSEQPSVFEALIHQESGGRNNVVSHAGAVGRTQLMLPTARIMARKLGMKKIAKLPRRRLRRMLMRNPRLNEKLGRAYFNEGLERYGRKDLALIYYNGGPRAANAAYRSWKKSGRMNIYTGETYCYVKSISRKAGIEAAPMRLVRGRAYRKNKSRWIRRTGRAPCRI